MNNWFQTLSSKLPIFPPLGGLRGAFGAMVLLLVSCSDDDLATAPDQQPVCSADTLHMGMILAGNSSPTYQLKLYNRCSKELRLDGIRLRNAAESGFRINVDGMNGSEFMDRDLLRIPEGDSLFIFVEATFPPAGNGLTTHYDYLDILCNSRQQSIVLEAQSKDVLRLTGEVIQADQTWLRGQEIQIFDSLVVAEGVTLTLEDSVTLYLHDKADIRVRGTLVAEGRQEAPVVIRGDRTDNMFDNLPYDNLPSQWGSLYIERSARDCRFEWTDIHGLSTGIHIDSTRVTFNSCRLRNSDGNLITCHMSDLQLLNSELSNASGSLLDLYGGWYDIAHCTLANYHFASVIRQPAVHLCNIDTAQAWVTPLHRCNFLNTLVWGRTFNPDVYPEYYPIALDFDALGRPVLADSVFSYRFDHCLLRAEGYDDDDFIQTLWNQDPLYRLIDDDNYTFDFRLQPESPALGAGASLDSIGLRLPHDLDGMPRDGSRPSVGCYENEGPSEDTKAL